MTSGGHTKPFASFTQYPAACIEKNQFWLNTKVEIVTWDAKWTFEHIELNINTEVGHFKWLV